MPVAGEWEGARTLLKVAGGGGWWIRRLRVLRWTRRRDNYVGFGKIYSSACSDSPLAIKNDPRRAADALFLSLRERRQTRRAQGTDSFPNAWGVEERGSYVVRL